MTIVAAKKQLYAQGYLLRGRDVTPTYREEKVISSSPARGWEQVTMGVANHFVPGVISASGKWIPIEEKTRQNSSLLPLSAPDRIFSPFFVGLFSRSRLLDFRFFFYVFRILTGGRLGRKLTVRYFRDALYTRGCRRSWKKVRRRVWRLLISRFEHFFWGALSFRFIFILFYFLVRRLLWTVRRIAFPTTGT